jgi:uncharacterized protein YsxB (DUF464 family)
MVLVSLIQGKGDLEVEASGHALFDKKNKDIVCSAVSILLENWLLSEKALCNARAEKIVRESGSFHCGINGYNGDQLLLFRSLSLGLMKIEEQYPNNIKVTMEDYNGR